MSAQIEAQIQHAARAAQKLEQGILLTIEEVSALLSVPPTTVHKLPLPSIRLVRNLRFDPRDVIKLIEACKEPVVH